MKLTIITMVHKETSNLAKIYRALLSQTNKNFDWFIYVNSDTPLKCVSELSDIAPYPWYLPTIVFDKSVSSSGMARTLSYRSLLNSGLDIGDFVSVIDSDDNVPTKYVETILSYVDKDTDLAFIDYSLMIQADGTKLLMSEIDRFETIKEGMRKDIFPYYWWQFVIHSRHIDKMVFANTRIFDDVRPICNLADNLEFRNKLKWISETNNGFLYYYNRNDTESASQKPYDYRSIISCLYEISYLRACYPDFMINRTYDCALYLLVKALDNKSKSIVLKSLLEWKPEVRMTKGIGFMLNRINEVTLRETLTPKGELV